MTNIYDLEAKLRVKVPDNTEEDAKGGLAALLEYIGVDAYEIEVKGIKVGGASINATAQQAAS